MIKFLALGEADIATFKCLLPEVINVAPLLAMCFLCCAMTYIGTLW